MDISGKVSRLVAQFHATRMAPLMGAKIVSLNMDPGEGEAIIGMTLECTDGKKREVWFMADAEGNGPGWLDIVGDDTNGGAA